MAALTSGANVASFSEPLPRETCASFPRCPQTSVACLGRDFRRPLSPCLQNAASVLHPRSSLAQNVHPAVVAHVTFSSSKRRSP